MRSIRSQLPSLPVIALLMFALALLVGLAFASPAQAGGHGVLQVNDHCQANDNAGVLQIVTPQYGYRQQVVLQQVVPHHRQQVVLQVQQHHHRQQQVIVQQVRGHHQRQQVVLQVQDNHRRGGVLQLNGGNRSVTRQRIVTRNR